jgi:hypothetical protein
MRYRAVLVFLTLSAIGHAASSEDATPTPTPKTNDAKMVEAAGGELAATLQLRGVFYFEGTFRFNVIDASGRSSGWVKLNERALGRLVSDFDPATDTVTLAAAPGQPPIRLRLAASKVFDRPATLSFERQPQPIAAGVQPEIPAAVQAQSPSTFAAAQNELPPAVRDMMFPPPNSPRAMRLAHPSDAAPAAASAAVLPPDVARYFPATPGPKWDSPVVRPE